MNEEDFDQFIKDRDEALLSLDKDKIVAYAKKYNVRMYFYDNNPEIFWTSVHKAITINNNLPYEFRLKSKKWLMDHDSQPIDGGDL